MVDTQKLAIIYGCILGDAKLEKPYPGNSRMHIRHSASQFEYLKYKHELLKPYSLGIFEIRSFDKRYGKTYHAYGFNTIRDRIFTELYHLFYPNGVKIVPKELINVGDEWTLAMFIGDDGTFDANSKTIKISVDAYDMESRKVIVKWLHTRFGIEATIEKDRIYILKRFMPKVISLVKDLLPESLHYKLGSSRSSLSA